MKTYEFALANFITFDMLHLVNNTYYKKNWLKKKIIYQVSKDVSYFKLQNKFFEIYQT